MAAPRQGLPVRLDRAPQRGAAFALTSASRRARTRSIGSRSRTRGSSLIFDHPPPPLLRTHPPTSARAPHPPTSQRRLLYVAMTRAKDDLHLIVPQRFFAHLQQSNGDRHMYASRTRFIPDDILGNFQGRAWPVASLQCEPVSAPRLRQSDRSLHPARSQNTEFSLHAILGVAEASAC
jgi:hypothetical protein